MHDYLTVIEELKDICEQLQCSRLVTLAKFLQQRISNPDTYLVFLGESCSGKSTLINRLLDHDVLPVSAVPSTAAVTEVLFDAAAGKEAFYAINKNATMEELDREDFKQLALQPDDELERLRYTTPAVSKDYQGVRIFDTPGYGSLVEQHDEVLMNFLPNSDAVTYVISYKNGFQEADYDFLKSLLELVRETVPFYLVINRCPEGVTRKDRRIKEIYEYVKGFLQKGDIPLTLIGTCKEDDCTEVRQSMRKLMDGIMEDLNSAERTAELEDAFRGYLSELIVRVKAEVERNLRNRQMSDEAKAALHREVEELCRKFREAGDRIVKPGFKKVREGFSAQVEVAEDNLKEIVCHAVDEQEILSKQETTTYIKLHVLNYNAQEQVKKLQSYLETEIDAIDREVDDYLNTAITKFEEDLKLKSPGALYDAGLNAAKGFGARLVNAGLSSYFAGFGGAGGAAAGIANAASHALKKLGQLFGKTFSRETHNALKHTLKVLGLTSTKTLAASAAGFMEIVTFAGDLATWKHRLKKQVKGAVKDWAKDLKTVSLEDLQRLEEQNMQSLADMAEEYERGFSEDETEEAKEKISIAFLQEKMERLTALETQWSTDDYYIGGGGING